MRIAIILTGALRTIKKTIRYFKQNLVRPEIDIFACIQNDTQDSEIVWNEWFSEQFGSHLRSITWFSEDNYREWPKHREFMLHYMQIDGGWKDYLRRSGSMIEYFQLQLAYMKLAEYENICKISYDYLIRARTDSIYAKPIDFHWLNWTDDEVATRIEKVQEELTLSKIDINQTIPYFMSTITSDEAIPNIQYIHATCYLAQNETFYEMNAVKLNDYIKHGRYILTFRKNNLYIVRRELFYLIPALGTMYGQFRSPYSDSWWFNAEGQFTSICYHACLTTFDYNTDFEDKSVEKVGWNEATFFDTEFNCINPRMLYCVVRA
jgi:hypothetical protein